MVMAVGLGLLGFVEPCSVGTHFLYIKYLETRSGIARIGHTMVFALTRATFMAILGLLAAGLGGAFIGVQHTFWVILGVMIAALGAFYLLGGTGWLMATLARLLPRLPDKGTSAGLGVLFGLNIPICAAPLLAVLLGTAAAQSATTGSVLTGTVALFLFGLALSAPLLLAVISQRGRRWLDAIAGISGRMPKVTGIVLVLLGGWSIAMGVTA